MERTTAIVVCSDAGFLPAACCQLLSTAQHLSGPDAAQLFLVCCDVDEADLAETRRFFDRCGIDVQLIVPDCAKSIQPIETRWPRAAYLRLYFDLLFGPEFDRLVYFDADTRVRAPLAPLLDADLAGKPVGAVHDFIYYVTGNIRRRRRDLFLADDAPYLQSGVMVFDWPATLADRSLPRARRFLSAHPDRCREAPDQDALNAVLEGRWTPLDPRWNLHETYLRFHGHRTPFLEHYTSSKPWSSNRPPEWREAASWYQRELSATAWADFVEPQTFVDGLHVRYEFLRFRYIPKLRDACARYAPAALDLIGVPRVRDESVPLPWAPRSRAVVERMTDALIREAAGECALLRPPEAAIASASPSTNVFELDPRADVSRRDAAAGG